MACTGVKKTKQCLTLKDKLEILKMYDSTEGNIKVNELAKTLKISRSTLVTIINNRKTIENAPESDRHRFRTRNRRDNPYAGKSKYQLLDNALADWVRKIKAEGKPFNGVILRNKALELANELGFENFTASNGWSDRFKKKYNFEYKTKPCYCNEQPKLVKKSQLAPSSHGTINFVERIMREVQQKKPNRRNTAQEQKCKYAEIEEKLIEWLDEAKNEQMKINGILIKEMALTLAGILGIENFTASSGWLNRFQKKYHLLRYKTCINCQSNDAAAFDKNLEEGDEEKTSFNNQLTFRIDKASESSTDDPDEETFVKKKRKLDVVSDREPIVIDKREECFKELSKKLSKEEEYQKIRLRLDKMEIELKVLNLATELLNVKKLNMQLDIENSKLRLQLLECL